MARLAILRHHFDESEFPRTGLGDDPSVAQLLSYIRDFVYYNPPVVWWVLLSISIVLTCGIGLIIGFVLLRRIFARNLWLLRWERGVMIPNTMMTFLLIEGLYICGFLLYLVLWYPVHLADKLSAKALGIFWVTVWIPLWAGGFWAAWGTLWSIPSDVLGRRSFLDKRGSAFLLNGFFVLIHLIVIAPAVTLVVLFMPEYTRSLDVLSAFEALCAQEANMNAPASAELIAAGIKAWKAYTESLFWLGVSFWFWFVIAWLHLVIYGTIGGLLIQRLTQHTSRHVEIFKSVLTNPAPAVPVFNNAAHQQTFTPAIKPVEPSTVRTRGQVLGLALRNVRIHYYAIMILGLAFSFVALGTSLVLQGGFLQGPTYVQRGQLTVNLSLAIVNALVGSVAGYGLFWHEIEPVVFMWRGSESTGTAATTPFDSMAKPYSALASPSSTGDRLGCSHLTSDSSGEHSNKSDRTRFSATVDSEAWRASRYKARSVLAARPSDGVSGDLELQLLQPIPLEVLGSISETDTAQHRLPSTESFASEMSALRSTEPAESTPGTL